MSSTWSGIILRQLTILVYPLTKKFASGWSYPELEELYHGFLQHIFVWHPSKLWQLNQACQLDLGECGLNGSFQSSLGIL